MQEEDEMVLLIPAEIMDKTKKTLKSCSQIFSNIRGASALLTVGLVAGTIAILKHKKKK